MFQRLYREVDGIRFGSIFEYTRPSLLIRDKKTGWTDTDQRFFVVSRPRSAIRNPVNDEDKLWWKYRRELTPTFTTGKVKNMLESILNWSRGRSGSGKLVNGKLTATMIVSCGFGLQYDTSGEEFRHPPRTNCSKLTKLLRIKTLYFVNLVKETARYREKYNVMS